MRLLVLTVAAAVPPAPDERPARRPRQSSASAEQVSASTQQTSASTQEIASSAAELARTAEALAALVARFRVTA